MLRYQSLLFIQKRWKHPKGHWSLASKKKFPKDRALENFDDFYGSVYGKKWGSIRAALLTQHKYIALVNTFGDTEEVSAELESAGALNLKSLINIAKERFNATDINTIEKKTPYLDEKLLEITKAQKSRDIASIYPSSNEEKQLDDIVLSREELRLNKEPDLDNSKGIDYKKSLEQSLEEDVKIDYRRLVNPMENNIGPMYDYVPASKIKGMEDWIPESDYYKYYSTTTDFPLKTEIEKDFEYPENLLIYSYEKGNCSDWIPPKKCKTGVQSHYLMDGASILPPLMLNIKDGDLVLDSCSGPGGKALLMIQTLYPKTLVCNDIQENRVNRIHNVMTQFIINYKEKWNGKQIILQKYDARHLNEYDKYDKILVDVPCTTDRHCLIENDNNIFKPTRIKERLRIPEMQSAILANCLRLLKPGGSLVYSTCSLSPVQNDGVIHMALQKVFTEYGVTATVKDLSLVIRLFSDIFNFENPKNLKYGQLVLPYLPANYGPMYISKLTRNS